eukprot:2623547-Rhodomonas_salina.1
MVLQVAAYLMSHNLFYRRAHGPLFDMVAWEAEDMQDLRGFADGRQVGLIRKDVHLGHDTTEWTRPDAVFSPTKTGRIARVAKSGCSIRTSSWSHHTRTSETHMPQRLRIQRVDDIYWRCVLFKSKPEDRRQWRLPAPA